MGYGSTWAHSDLSNTHLAMEALFYAKNTIGSNEEDGLDLDWDAAIQFVSRCQNLSEKNDEPGLVYFLKTREALYIFQEKVWPGRGLIQRGGYLFAHTGA